MVESAHGSVRERQSAYDNRLSGIVYCAFPQISVSFGNRARGATQIVADDSSDAVRESPLDTRHTTLSPSALPRHSPSLWAQQGGLGACPLSGATH